MSSVLLPSWKEEPLSPVSNDEVAWLSDETFYQSSPFEDNIKLEDDDLVPCESKAEVASLMLESLENLIDIDELIKEEPYLLDEKILPILEEVEQPRAIEVPLLAVKMEYARPSPDSTQFLLNEFERVYDVVEYSHGALTPPQSPPSEQRILTTLEPLLAQPLDFTLPENNGKQAYCVPEKQLVPHAVLEYRALAPQEYHQHQPMVVNAQQDIAHELAVVDELVRSRVENMQWSSPPSPNSNSSSSSSNFGDCSSDDPEWMPEPVENFAESAAPTTTKGRKRTKPYSRAAPVDKKSRKKEQNKNAATRYRMKKKAEVEVILGEEKELSDQNDVLDGKITDMQREIKYLKGLMRDLFKAKGLIN